MTRGKKKIVLPAGITPMKELDFRGMSREEIIGVLGLPEDVTTKEISNAILEEAGIKSTRRSKKQELTEAERKRLKEEKDRHRKELKEKRRAYLEAIGAPAPKKKEKKTKEQKLAARKARRERKKSEADKARSFALKMKKQWQKEGKAIPDWMQKLK